MLTRPGIPYHEWRAQQARATRQAERKARPAPAPQGLLARAAHVQAMAAQAPARPAPPPAPAAPPPPRLTLDGVLSIAMDEWNATRALQLDHRRDVTRWRRYVTAIASGTYAPIKRDLQLAPRTMAAAAQLAQQGTR